MSAAFASRVAGTAIRRFLEDQGPHLAGSIAYRVLFSLFPLTILLTAAFGIVARGTPLHADVIDSITAQVPLGGEGEEDFRALLEGATERAGGIGLLSLAGLLWAASGMMAAARAAVNTAWRVEHRRPFVRGKALDLAFVLAASVVVLISLALTLTFRVVEAWTVAALDVVGLDIGVAEWLLGLAAPALLAFGVVAALYRILPALDVPWRLVWPGALFATVMLAVLQSLFALYLRHFGDYDAVYGSLGAIVAFLLYVYLGANVFILGAELSAAWEPARRELENDDGEEGAPLAERVRGALRGLVRN